MKQTARPQQVVDRLAERWAEANRLRADCKLGLEPPRRRGGGCSACTTPQEFELDQGVAHLINAGVFKITGQCPSQVITSYLIAGLSFGPEAFRARSTGQYRADPVVEIRGALKRIHTVTKATKLTHEDIEALSDKLGAPGDRPRAACCTTIHRSGRWLIFQMRQALKLF